MQDYLVAADSSEEISEWLDACQQQVQQINDKMNQLRTKERQLRIASELSSLVVYCQAVPFNPDFELQDPRTSFYEMCSFRFLNFFQINFEISLVYNLFLTLVNLNMINWSIVVLFHLINDNYLAFIHKPVA
jgi:hypothetical protein